MTGWRAAAWAYAGAAAGAVLTAVLARPDEAGRVALLLVYAAAVGCGLACADRARAGGG